MEIALGGLRKYATLTEFIHTEQRKECYKIRGMRKPRLNGKRWTKKQVP